jgi:hypothetical protein
MLCKFQFPSWKNVSFHVEWFTDGFSVKNDTICKNQDADNEGAACDQRQNELKHGGFQAGHRVSFSPISLLPPSTISLLLSFLR